jgi:hypothetical protein
LVEGFDAFTGIVAGSFRDGFVVELEVAGLYPGLVAGEIQFHPKGLVDTGFREPSDPITLNLRAELLNQPPDCSQAAPSRSRLWPPNHKFRSVKIRGVTDPDGDPVAITIDSIRQDEPVSTSRGRRFSPDGKGVGTAKANLRAERGTGKKGRGNGRVYHISYTADDGLGGSCSGDVTVGVPPKKKRAPVDDGARYDSTVR